LREGYEGAIARIDGHAYKHGRSNALIKIKLAHDAEFRVVAFTSALRGSSRGAMLFVCETKTNPNTAATTFTVTPTGPISARRAYMRQAQNARFEPTDEAREKWLGKYIIVKFDALSRDGIPLRARTDGIIRAIQ
jgi:ATP-dependent DNA ligase